MGVKSLLLTNRFLMKDEDSVIGCRSNEKIQRPDKKDAIVKI